MRDVSPRPYDPRRPLVGLDEPSRHRLGEVTPPQPVAPGRPPREDDASGRGGGGTLVLVCEPPCGRRPVPVSDRRTRLDWAHCIQDLVEVRYPDAEVIVLVQDHRNTHTATPTPPPPALKPSRPLRPRGSPTSWNCTPRPSTAAG